MKPPTCELDSHVFSVRRPFADQLDRTGRINGGHGNVMHASHFSLPNFHWGMASIIFKQASINTRETPHPFKGRLMPSIDTRHAVSKAYLYKRQTVSIHRRFLPEISGDIFPSFVPGLLSGKGIALIYNIAWPKSRRSSLRSPTE